MFRDAPFPAPTIQSPLAPRAGSKEGGSPFGLALSSPFGASGHDIFDALNQVGLAEHTRRHGMQFLALDKHVQRSQARLLGMLASVVLPGGQYAENTTGAWVVLTSDADLAEALHAQCKPLPSECCVFVDCSQGEGQERCHFSIGTDLRRLVSGSVLSNATSAPLNEGFAPVRKNVAQRILFQIKSEGSATVESETETAGLFSLASVQQTVFRALDDCRRMLPSAADLRSYETQWFGKLQSAMEAAARSILDAGEQQRLADDDGSLSRDGLLDFNAQAFDVGAYASELSSGLLGKIDKAFKLLPDVGWVFEHFMAKLAQWYASSDLIALMKANQIFKQEVAATVLSKDTLADVFGSTYATFNCNQQQIGDLAVGGAVVGGTAFVVGTVYGIIYDIVSTFVMIIKYSFAGIKWVFKQGLNAASSAMAPQDMAPVSDETVQSWFPSFDLKTFFQQDLPEMCKLLVDLARKVIDDFKLHAAEYGQLVGQYMGKAMGGALQGTLKLMFDAYDASASLLERVWYVIKQWFRIGSVLGPLVVDIILMFCTAGTGTVLSAAAKLSKVEKLGDAMRFLKLSRKAVESLGVYKRMATMIPQRLVKLVQTVIQKVWNAVGAVKDQVSDALRLAFGSKVDAPDGDDVRWLLELVDVWYQRCSTLNFFIAVILLITGGSTVDQKGQVVQQPLPSSP
ncbi:hypothetical protein [Hydrogenophaga sp. 5NK40-0174]|uniref:hypothetical protein n=1 Tax=Hydrogenophaga sp. 5NK40-0174 TaxID=3127649 RepID=UPI003107F60A